MSGIVTIPTLNGIWAVVNWKGKEWNIFIWFLAIRDCRNIIGGGGFLIFTEEICAQPPSYHPIHLHLQGLAKSGLGSGCSILAGGGKIWLVTPKKMTTPLRVLKTILPPPQGPPAESPTPHKPSSCTCSILLCLGMYFILYSTKLI